MRFDSLDEWLSWQEGLHPSEIDLGLERVAKVLDAMGRSAPGFTVVTVGGTNGKGSVCAFLDAMLRADGRSVGLYRSPHLIRYNERILIDGEEVSDEELCRAFDKVDRARGDSSITYFEFGTLAAIELFAERGVEVALLEVGLGGRLDAVNVLDAGVAVVTSVGIDHQAWLGDDREAIGREKAGILRADRPAVCGDWQPPLSLLQHATAIGARLQLIGRDFQPGEGADETEWSWSGAGGPLENLPTPALHGPFQLGNAATAIAAALALPRPPARSAIERGLREACLAGRFQRLATPGEGAPECIVDVGHNPHAAAALSEALAAEPVEGRTLAVIAMLDDKDVAGVVAEMRPVVDAWYPAGLAVPRGLDVRALATRMGVATETPSETVEQALAAARKAATATDRIVVFGSFYTVAEALRLGV